MFAETLSHTDRTCTTPAELSKLYHQWKNSPTGLSAEQHIALRLPNIYATAENDHLIKPLGLVAFGVYLAQETFPISKKFSTPHITLDRIGASKSMALLILNHRAIEITVNKSWLTDLTQAGLSFANNSTIRVIDSSIEELSHWVLHRAIEQYQSSQQLVLFDEYYQQTLDQAEIISTKAVATLTEFSSLGWLQYLWLFFTGKMGRRLENLKAELSHALLDHLANPDEYMGIIWRKAVAKKYYPWSFAVDRATQELTQATAHKRHRASQRRLS